MKVAQALLPSFNTIIYCNRQNQESFFPFYGRLYWLLEGNPGKIARSGLFQDHPPSPLYPIIGTESKGSVLSPDSSKREESQVQKA